MLYIQNMGTQSNEEARELSISRFVILLLGAASIFGVFLSCSGQERVLTRECFSCGCVCVCVCG